MKELPKISDAEWQVMKVVWKKTPITSSEIIDGLKQDSLWSSKTIHTLISRLVKKEALGVEKNSSHYLYYPLVSEEECKREETKSFLQKVYDGSINLLISNFIKEEKLTEEEIEELQSILNKSKK
ncbi:BlaI/MecI/CopY family transcriptional regulator [Clostridium sp. CX1]|uniref:BlaI/MecI/CopY family transcriptional regulator n=1 Tax=Clostridium sp. CX1 TaxID=2978346 RepID=UPI0021BE7F35|nr:BlaI/MecI/CopY family transcriptional regulator [Clostridium sp. CX1]MCT8978432.1 BlaI/MecI/CopY family transcriptional regulator [Clostridium sp. CX1]